VSGRRSAVVVGAKYLIPRFKTPLRPLLFFFSAPPQHNTHHTTQLRQEVELGTANPKKLKKWEIINSQDLKAKPRFRS
jgi:hypothetical protein